jgi:hypothetical protein
MEQLLIEHEIVPSRSRREKPTQISPLVWPNLVCLDAPLVAVTWQWLFARAFQVPLTNSARLTLFLTAWLIYLADRLADNWSLDGTEHLSLRQRFCRRHWRIWIAVIPPLALADCVLILQQLDRAVTRVGLVIGVLSLGYLSINYWLGKTWRSVPVKEVCIGCLFASGTVAAVVPRVGLSAMFLVALAFFSALCLLNCISIAIWERDLDLTQGKNSIATRWPNVRSWFVAATITLAICAIIIGLIAKTAASLYYCAALSGFLLVAVDSLGKWFGRDERTAMADLVLLTPLLLFLVESLAR